jgi:hypothetical protein
MDIAASTFIRAARCPLRMEATGAAPPESPPDVCGHVAAQHEEHGRGRASAERPGCLRRPGRIAPGCRD